MIVDAGQSMGEGITRGSALPTRALKLAALGIGMLLHPSAEASLPSDIGRGPSVAVLAQPASKHWVWVNDFVFPHMSDSMAYLIDGDSGRYLGTLSTGYGYAHLLLPRDGKVIYSPETYFSRGTRGTRTDVVTVYDSATLNVLQEIPIPPKRSSNLPMIANVALTDDDRFLLIYNFNPAQSISIVDTKQRRFVHEVESSGCALVYPTGSRSFFSLCGDGAVLLFTLNEKGAAVQHRTEPLFDPYKDPVKEKAVRVKDMWYFVSFAGRVLPLATTASTAVLQPTWWLTSEAERKAGWRTGGLQELAVDTGSSQLFAIMHQGPLASHKDPGKEIWVYDLATQKRVRQIHLKEPASSIQVTSDPTPLLFALQMDSTDLDVYDAHSGRFLRPVGHVGTTPTLLVTPD